MKDVATVSSAAAPVRDAAPSLIRNVTSALGAPPGGAANVTVTADPSCPVQSVSDRGAGVCRTVVILNCGPTSAPEKCIVPPFAADAAPGTARNATVPHAATRANRPI